MYKFANSEQFFFICVLYLYDYSQIPEQTNLNFLDILIWFEDCR